VWEGSNRIGSLVINPGGPGVSGIDDFANELAALTPQLLDDFDIVTFDPRGVRRSSPVTWSLSLAHELSQGHLLTVDGSDHVSYFYSSCVRAYVQTYLINLATPPVGATCSD
jgi:pimeloyl-ACP methyl ester carboxylesterase